MGQLPTRQPRITDEQQAEIVRLALRQVPQAQIARRVGVHRNTVRRTLDRTRGTLAVTESLTEARAEAVAVYREVQAEAWAAIEKGRAPAVLLGEIIRAQTRIDAVLGIDAGAVDQSIEVETFKRIVLTVVHEVEPAVRERIIARLEEARAADRFSGHS